MAVREVFTEWTERLRAEAKGNFPEKVTAFRDEMAAHGKYGRPCPRCGTTIQRIRYAANETNYCPTCQTGGRLLADRALVDGKPTAYVCEHFACRRPVTSPEDLRAELDAALAARRRG